MQFSLFTTFLLLTSLTHGFPSFSGNSDVEKRQQAPQTTIQTTTCADYSRLANYTVINKNSTIRAAFLRGSPAGTDPTRSILDLAFKEFTAKNLMFDKPINAKCGNLSTLAMTAVNANFSQGVVAGFKVVPTYGAEIGAGRELFLVGFAFLMFAGFGLSI